MKIAIIGAGSIGLLLGSFFREASFEVTMIVRRKEQKDFLNEKGIRRFTINQTESTFRVRATDDFKEVLHADLIIIAVKYIAIHEVIKQLEDLTLQTPLLFIQNGIAHYSDVLETKLPNLSFATIEHGALKIDDGSVNHNGVGNLTIAEARGNQPVLHKISAIQLTEFPIHIHNDAEYILMRKVLINCLINPLTAVLQVKNGALLTNPSAFELLKKLFEELSNAFPMMHSCLSLDDVKMVCDNTKHNRSSMFADRLAGRKMEIETIVSAVVKKAADVQKDLPILTILEKMLYAVDGKGEG